MPKKTPNAQLLWKHAGRTFLEFYQELKLLNALLRDLYGIGERDATLPRYVIQFVLNMTCLPSSPVVALKVQLVANCHPKGPGPSMN